MERNLAGVIGQSLEAGKIDAAVLDGALVRPLKNKGFSVIADTTPANIPMLNQAHRREPGVFPEEG